MFLIMIKKITFFNEHFDLTYTKIFEMFAAKQRSHHTSQDSFN